MPDLKPYTILKDKHPGEIAWIVGSGTSFFGIYNHARFPDIQQDVVCAVNTSIYAMPWGLPHVNPDITHEAETDSQKRYWNSNDALCRRWNWWDYVKKCNATKIVRSSWSRYYREIPDFLYFWPRSTSEDVINPDDEGLAYCSSIPSSIDLAIQMGCKLILLLGIDQYFSHGKSHYWQFFEKKKQPFRYDRSLAPKTEQTSVFGFNNIAYPALKGFADIRKVEIFNCNPQSRVESFEKITFDQGLEKADGHRGSS